MKAARILTCGRRGCHCIPNCVLLLNSVHAGKYLSVWSVTDRLLYIQCATTSGRLHGNAQRQVQACSKGRCRAGKANCDQAKLHQAGQAQILCNRTWSTSQACLCQGMSVSCGPEPAAGVPVLLSLLKLLYNKVYRAREWYLESMCVFIVMTCATGIYQSLCCLCVLTQSKHR